VTFLLAHLSDAHIGPLPRPQLRELLGKRLTGYVNWNRRGRLHDMQVLGDLVADIKAQKPNHIVMTGDILNLGLAAEFPFAETWLRSLGDPHDVSFVPGNHDAYVRASMAPLAATFVPWLTDMSIVGSPSPQPAFPYLRQRGGVALIGLSSALPTAPFLASGALGAAQREALGPLLAEARRRKLVRVLMIHHPPYRAGASTGRGLRDASAFARIIAAHGAELILHGHNHRAMLAHLPGPHGPVPVVGVPSASAIPGSLNHRAAYHLFRFEPQAAGWNISAARRGLLPDLSAVGDLGPVELAAGEGGRTDPPQS
jgi:3',5'-cyclic AMP phosphodiesterase CpdA